MQAAITNQPYPINFAGHRNPRCGHLPTFTRSKPYMEEPHHGRDH